MNLILSIAIAALAMLDAFLAIGFFLDPATAGSDFGMRATGAMGLSAMRADFTAFFLVSALFMALGAWRRWADALLPPVALFAVAFTGRLVNLIAVGPYDGYWLPMAVEMTHIVVLALAIRAWPWRASAIAAKRASER